jgi:hypothetical protein
MADGLLHGFLLNLIVPLFSAACFSKFAIRLSCYILRESMLDSGAKGINSEQIQVYLFSLNGFQHWNEPSPHCILSSHFQRQQKLVS